MNLTQCVARVADIINRNNLQSQIVDAVNTTIRKIEMSPYNFSYMYGRYYTQAPAGSYEFNVPANLKRPVKATWALPASNSEVNPLPFGDDVAARMEWPDYVVDTGEPQVLAFPVETPAKFILRPTPDQEYSIFIYAFCRSNPLVLVDNETHWLLDNFEDLIVYGACIEMMPIIKDWDRDPVWRGRFKEAYTLLKSYDSNRNYDAVSGNIEGAYR